MDPFYKQDIFFFITTIAVVVLTIVLVVAGIYAVKILKDIKYIAKKAKVESDLLAKDMDELRANVRQEGAKLKHLGKFFSSFYKRRKN